MQVLVLTHTPDTWHLPVLSGDQVRLLQVEAMVRPPELIHVIIGVTEEQNQARSWVGTTSHNAPATA